MTWAESGSPHPSLKSNRLLQKHGQNKSNISRIQNSEFKTCSACVHGWVGVGDVTERGIWLVELNALPCKGFFLFLREWCVQRLTCVTQWEATSLQCCLILHTKTAQTRDVWRKCPLECPVNCAAERIVVLRNWRCSATADHAPGQKTPVQVHGSTFEDNAFNLFSKWTPDNDSEHCEWRSR